MSDRRDSGTAEDPAYGALAMLPLRLSVSSLSFYEGIKAMHAFFIFCSPVACPVHRIDPFSRKPLRVDLASHNCTNILCYGISRTVFESDGVYQLSTMMTHRLSATCPTPMPSGNANFAGWTTSNLL